MAATIVSSLTNISLVNDNTGFDVWKRDGTGGTPSPISETDVFKQGTGACSVKVSNQGVVLAFGTGGLNLSASNTHLYIWVNMLAAPLMVDRANNGLCIFLCSDANVDDGANYKMWAVDGGDTYPGGWVRYVIDISKTATVDIGTLNTAAVTWVGMYCDTRPNVAKFDNLIIDRIDYTVGPGLRVYGTSTTDDLFGDIWTADAGTLANQYGIIREVQGVYYLKGRIELGDDVGINACNLTDIDKTIVYENPEYYNGAAVVSCVSSTLYRFDVVGNGTGDTTVQFGKKVGAGDTASGRNGLTIFSAGPDVTMDFDDGNANSVLIYGTVLRFIDGGLSWGTNVAHEFIGSTIDQCAQFDPVGGIVMRNNIFSGYGLDPDGALLWNESIDIKNSKFIANADAVNDPAAIEHPSAVGSPYAYTNLEFSGNDYDVNNTSGSGITITKSGTSNPSTYEGSLVTFVGSVPLSIHVVDKDDENIQDAQCAIYKKSDDSELMNEDTLASGMAEEDYTGGTPIDIYYRIRKASPGATLYKSVYGTGIIDAGGFSVTVRLLEDVTN